MNRIPMIGLILGLVTLMLSGCGSLSLLSSRHVHYHGSQETDNKVDQLEKRVEALEKAAGRQL